MKFDVILSGGHGYQVHIETLDADKLKVDLINQYRERELVLSATIPKEALASWLYAYNEY